MVASLKATSAAMTRWGRHAEAAEAAQGMRARLLLVHAEKVAPELTVEQRDEIVAALRGPTAA